MKNNKHKIITVIGLGYIGLPTAALLASEGWYVQGFDVNSNIVEIINSGNIHIIEPDLDTLVRNVIKNKKLKAFNQIMPADIYIICVPTPLKLNELTPKPDISYIDEAIEKIFPHVKGGDLIILESTSPVGTTEKIEKKLSEGGVDTSDIAIAYCPERVLPGNIISELKGNNRVVGGINISSTQIASNFYNQFVKGEIMQTDSRTAEMCKLTENSFRDINIAFANELSVICDSEGIDVWELISLANRHPRVNILQPGPGVGGHCIAVDPWFIVAKNIKESNLIKTSRLINDEKPKWVANKVLREYKNQKNILTRDPIIACFGLTFKPNIDDLRESPALQIAESLIAKGCEVIAIEPNISKLDNITLVDAETALKNADINVLLVKHSEFLDKKILAQLNNLLTLDFCGVLRV